MKLGNRLAVGEVVDHTPVDESVAQTPTAPSIQPVQVAATLPEAPAEPVAVSTEG